MTFPGMNSAPSSTSNSSVYDNLTGGGMGATPGAESQAPAEMSPADSAINKIGSLIQMFEQISSSYPNVADSSKQAATQAIYKYMEDVVGSLNSGGSPANSGGLGSATSQTGNAGY
jgi:membrane protein involved in colicin uptake